MVAQMVKCLPTMWETWVRSLGQEDPLEQEMATHSSTLAWKIPWMEEPGRLQSMGLQRVGHDWVTSLHFTNAGDVGSVPGLGRFPGKRSGYLLQYTCLENSMNRGAGWAAVHGVAKSQVQLSAGLVYITGGSPLWCFSFSSKPVTFNMSWKDPG